MSPSALMDLTSPGNLLKQLLDSTAKKVAEPRKETRERLAQILFTQDPSRVGQMTQPTRTQRMFPDFIDPNAVYFGLSQTPYGLLDL